MIDLVIVIAVGYLAGAIPFSYIAGKLFAGIDLREYGSGNLGASNTFRFLGPKIALVVLVMDVLKGFLPVYLASRIGADSSVPAIALMLAAAFAAIIGHMFSVFVRFKGGKGIATSAGAFLGLAPLALLCAFVVWVVVFAATRIMSAGTIAAAVSLPLIIWALEALDIATYPRAVLAVSILITLVILAKHKSNIRRLMAGEEPKLQRHKT